MMIALILLFGISIKDQTMIVRVSLRAYNNTVGTCILFTDSQARNSERNQFYLQKSWT